MDEFDTNIPPPEKAKESPSDMALRMPVGSSKLFDSKRDALRLVYAMHYQRFKCSQQKRTMEKHGEVGHRVWKLGNL